MIRKIRVGVIGFGRMGRGFVSVMQQSDRWEIVSICDLHEAARELAGKLTTIEHVNVTPDLLAALLGEMRKTPVAALIK